MTRLLVSVRSAVEAEIALAAGADLIDAKEPNAGSLGKVRDDVLDQIAHTVEQHGNRVPLSMACGELRDFRKETVAFEVSPRAFAKKLQFAKIGLQGCANWSEWQAAWIDWRNQLSNNTEPVLVIYADDVAAKSPSIDELLKFARLQHLRFILIDTFDKSGPALCDLWNKTTLAHLVHSIHSEGRKIVLAGKLTLKDAAELIDLRPDYLAVRGAVCEDATSNQNTESNSAEQVRTGKICTKKILAWKSLLNSTLKNVSEPTSVA